MRSQARILAWLLLLLLATSISRVRLPGIAEGQERAGAEKPLALVGAKIYRSPAQTPIANGVVVTSGGKIVIVGEKRAVKIPAEASTLDCSGRSLVAGF